MEINMLYLLSFILILIGLIINKENAKYLLSGYNMLPEKERNHFDLINFLKFFKRSFLLLGVSYLIIGLLISASVKNPLIFIIYSVLFPLIGVFFIIYKSIGYYKPNKWSWAILTFGLMIIIAIMVGICIGLAEVNVTIKGNKIYTSGPYAIAIDRNQIKAITIEKMPVTVGKIEGFEMGKIKKGIFKLSDGGNATILSNGKDSCFIILTIERNTYILDYRADLKNKLYEKIER